MSQQQVPDPPTAIVGHERLIPVPIDGNSRSVDTGDDQVAESNVTIAVVGVEDRAN